MAPSPRFHPTASLGSHFSNHWTHEYVEEEETLDPLLCLRVCIQSTNSTGCIVIRITDSLTYCWRPSLVAAPSSYLKYIYYYQVPSQAKQQAELLRIGLQKMHRPNLLSFLSLYCPVRFVPVFIRTPRRRPPTSPRTTIHYTVTAETCACSYSCP